MLYQKIPTLLLLFLLLNLKPCLAQQGAITFELNGRTAEVSEKNPFRQFVGEWTLKEDNWSHDWGSGPESIKIPHHHTINKAINTDNSLLSIIDGPEPNGHIFWSYNPTTQEVHHLSSFGTIRAGAGKGTIDEQGDVRLKLTFAGEPQGTYRRYHYHWISADEYHMKSVQYGADDQPTGQFYEGTFVRLVSVPGQPDLRAEVEDLLAVLDNQEISVAEQLKVYQDDIVHLAPNQAAHTDKTALGAYLEEQRTYGTVCMKHQILELEDMGSVVVVRGAVSGNYYPKNGNPAIAFKTKNLFVLKREAGQLKIAKVIYNAAPNE